MTRIPRVFTFGLLLAVLVGVAARAQDAQAPSTDVPDVGAPGPDSAGAVDAPAIEAPPVTSDEQLTLESKVTPAPLDEWQTDFRLRLGGVAEGARDLGTADGEAYEEGFADAQLTVQWQPHADTVLFGRVEGFAPSGEVIVTGDEERARRSESYARLRELWFDYGGFTAYPGEHLRIGLQRLRDADGQWLDRDIESVRWIFDTTLVQGHLGVAESFLTYRSDGSEPPSAQRDRAHGFGGIGRQWRVGHYLGLRALHAFDHADAEAQVIEEPRDPKLEDDRLTWIDLYAHNGYYTPATAGRAWYWVDARYLTGTREDYTPATLLEPALRTRNSVDAFAADLGLRWRVPGSVPWQFGLAAAYGSGSADDSGRFEQTGLHSNRSRYTGTRSLVHRFNEAFQPELSNLYAGTVYLSLPMPRWDANLALHRFVRDSRAGGVISEGVDLAPSTDARVLGNGADLVLAYYFGARAPSLAREDEDLRSSLRLRASAFEPGRAYVSDADTQYRVLMELTLWF